MKQPAVRILGRPGMVMGLLGMLLFALGNSAWASTGQDGPSPPKVGDPVGADVSPHGGYSSSSNFCLQCHEVHQAQGEYALLWKSSVTDTCNTCHGMLGAASGTGTRTPWAGSGTPGTASVRSVYDAAFPSAQHGLGATHPPGETGVTITEADWSYGWRFSSGPPGSDATTPAGAGTSSAGAGGLYCASCHTPHGEFGQAVNTKWALSSNATGDISTQRKVAWQNGKPIWFNDPAAGWVYRYLHKVPSGWKLCTDTSYTSCKPAQVRDAEGQLVSLYGYKLLSAYPNHTYSKPVSYGVDKYDHDSQKWCAACHPSKVDTSAGGTFHNHPTGCTACHGNPANASSADFPHTSSRPGFLKEYPDALCVGCHTVGALP